MIYKKNKSDVVPLDEKIEQYKRHKIHHKMVTWGILSCWAVAVFCTIYDNIKDTKQDQRFSKNSRYMEVKQKSELAKQEYADAKREFDRVRDSLKRAEKAQKSNQK